MNQPSDPKTGRCFTLIELLVVIAIIAILASMLLPALSRARNAVKTAKCSNNQRQIMTALFMYTDDNNDFGPWARKAANLDIWWNSLIYPYISNNATYYLTDRSSVFTCPSFMEMAPDALISMGFSHMINNYFAGQAVSINISKIRKPGNKIYFMDGNGYVVVALAQVNPSGTYYARYRHNGKINFAMSDGHVETTGWKITNGNGYTDNGIYSLKP